MRKLLLGILIIILLVGVTYYKNQREQAQEQTVYAEGFEAGEKQALENSLAIDSIERELAREQEVIDSLKATGESHTVALDSLARLTRRQEARIGELQRENDRLAKKAEQAGSRTQQILAHYNQRYNDLPSDLSDYEYKVALTEIRTETAQKFGITTDELNRIRKRFNLDY